MAEQVKQTDIAPYRIKTEEIYRCGYGPRFIQSSLDGQTFFVTCKDGSVAVFPKLDQPKAQRPRPFIINPDRESGPAGQGVRAVCEWSDGILLVGRYDGTIDIYQWPDSNIEENERLSLLKEQLPEGTPKQRDTVPPSAWPDHNPEKKEEDAVAYIGWLDQSHLLISYKSKGSWIIRVDWQIERNIAGFKKALSQAHDADPQPRLQKISDVSAAFPVDDSWMIVCHDSMVFELFLTESGRPRAIRQDPWKQGPPGFLMDFGIAKTEPSGPPRGSKLNYTEIKLRGLFISTDLGVYFLRRNRRQGAGEKERIEAVQVLLPGFMNPMGVTYFEDEGDSGFLWVSNLMGEGFLYSLPKSFHNDPGPLILDERRQPVQKDTSQIIRAYSSWLPLDDCRVIWQTRRDDRVVLSFFAQNRTPEKEPSPDTLLRDLLAGLHKEKWESKAKEFLESNEEWQPEFLLAHVFQGAAERLDCRQVWIEYLANPTPGLGRCALRSIITAKPHPFLYRDNIEKRLKKGFEYWTYTLLGIIHRHAPSREASLYLGLICWLRFLEQAITEDLKNLIEEKAEKSGKVIENLRDTLHKCNRFIRKWGVFGSSYAERECLRIPLDALKELQNKASKIDWLVYDCLRFHRQLDLEGKTDGPKKLGKTALALETLLFEGRTLVFASWQREGVEVYELIKTAQGEPYRFLKWISLFPHVKDDNLLEWVENADDVKETEVGFCRALVVGKLDDQRVFLLASPHISSDKGNKNVQISLLVLNCAQGSKGPITLEYQRHKKLPLNAYSFLKLNKHWIAAGLEGEKGQAKLLFLKLEISRDPCDYDIDTFETEKETLPTVSPAGKELAHNPIWSLAKDQLSTSPDSHVFFAGCDDGQIWKINAALNDKKAAASSRIPIQTKLAARVGAPVLALDYRLISDPAAPLRNEKTERVYAGCSDGTILGFQNSIASYPDQGAMEASDPSVGASARDPEFSKLWATEESSQVIGCHKLEFSIDDGPEATPLVMAITQQGRAILFNDRAEYPKYQPGQEPWDHHSRRSMPGSRHGRPKLQANAFASAVFEATENGKAKERPLFLSATGDGQIRLYRWANPSNCGLYKKNFHRIREEWTEIWGQSYPFLSLGEAVYASAPNLCLILVHSLLNKDFYEQKPFDPHCLPRHLVNLYHFFNKWQTMGEGEEGPELKQILMGALKDAHNLGDELLAKTIIHEILKTANKDLFRFAAEEIETSRAKKLEKGYLDILSCLDRSRKLWLGLPQKSDIRYDIVFAKNMFDGDSMWRIAQMSRHPNTGSSFKEILKRRIFGVRQFLVKGDPLLALETLRATGLSLARAAMRLGEQRGKNWRPDHHKHEMTLSGFRSYYQTISDYAARISHPDGIASLAQSHEIARIYALGVCIAPSASIFIAHYMAEAGLTGDLVKRVIKQLDTLKSIGFDVPKIPKYLFETATRNHLEKALSTENKKLMATLGLEEDLSSEAIKKLCENQEAIKRIKDRIGRFNTKIVFAFLPFDYILKIIKVFAEQLQNNPENIDLSRSMDLMALARKSRAHWSEQEFGVYPWEQSFQFWEEAITNFIKQNIANAKSGKTSSNSAKIYKKPRYIKPQIVLNSKDLAKSFDNIIKRLKELYTEHKVFEPDYSIYSKKLQELKELTQNFRESAVIQKSIVQGVLNHGLLETLDEHVLELDEMAQALDPFMFLEMRGRPYLEEGEDKDYSTERKFAFYLLSRSKNAESIPKNLRSLQGLIGKYEPSASNPYKASELVKKIELSLAVDLEPLPSKGQEVMLSSREKRVVELIIKELIQNHRLHGNSKRPPEYVINPTVQQLIHLNVSKAHHKEDGEKLYFRFFWDPASREHLYTRLKDLKEEKLQNPTPPRPDRLIPSHGTGLYLANFAASTIGWALSIRHLDEILGHLVFSLEKVDKEERR